MKPFYMFLRVLAIIAGVEVLVMGIITLLGFPHGVRASLLDAGLLAALSAPLLYIIESWRDITERQRAEETLRQSADNYRLLSEVSQALISSLDLPGTLRKIADGSIAVLGADRCALYTLHEESDKMYVVLSRGISEEYLQAVSWHNPWPQGSVPSEQIFPQAAEEPSLAPFKQAIQKEGYQTLVFAPLLYKDQLLGKLALYHDQPTWYSPDQLKQLRTFANQSAVAIMRSQAEEVLRRSLVLERVLHTIDAALVQEQTAEELLGAVCDGIIEMGSRMCWVGIAEPDHTVRPVASRGVEEGYLSLVQVRWDDAPGGRGPVGEAIRTGRVVPGR